MDKVLTNVFNVITVRTSGDNGLVTTCINSINIQDYERISILDNGADTCVVDKSWKFVTVHPTRKAHIYVFDHKAAVKRHLNIMKDVTVAEVNGETILLQVNEAVYNPPAAHFLSSEFYIRDYEVKINSVSKKYKGD